MSIKTMVPASLAKLSGSRRKLVTCHRDALVDQGLLQPEHGLPYLITPRTKDVDLAAWIAGHADEVHRHLNQHGGILFRGFSPGDESGFQNTVQTAFGGQPLTYTYRSTPRTDKGDGVYTSTEYPADQTIALHNENAYTSVWPRLIFFYSMLCAQSGGETPIADSRRIYRRIDEKIRARFQEKGIMYVRNYGDIDLSWQEVFQTQKVSDVDRICSTLGISAEWRENGRLCTRQVCPAVLHHPDTGQPVWFNQAHLFHASALPEEVRLAMDMPDEELPRNTYYGDGSAIDPADLDEIRAAYDSEKTAFSWQTDDLLVLDNLLASHGRNPFTGPRKLVVTMRHAATWHADKVQAWNHDLRDC